MGGGRGVMGERRGRGKSRNMNRGLMGMDNGRMWTGRVKGDGAGESNREKDNCNRTTIIMKQNKRKKVLTFFHLVCFYKLTNILIEKSADNLRRISQRKKSKQKIE